MVETRDSYEVRVCTPDLENFQVLKLKRGSYKRDPHLRSKDAKFASSRPRSQNAKLVRTRKITSKWLGLRNHQIRVL